MNTISYTSASYPVRADFADTHNRYWQRLAAAGTWLTGAQRVAIAAEVRHAKDCALCDKRKSALSPAFVDGAHDVASDLADALVEVVHRVVTDPGRLTRKWFDGILAQGVSEEAYVETIGTIVFTFTVDEFCRALAIPLNPLPAPEAGDPGRYRPSQAVQDDAWVPWIPSGRAVGAESDLWAKGQAANVIRALSLVPDEVRTLKDLSAAHYVAESQDFMNFAKSPQGTLSRTQTEVIAGRVSSLNGCFY